MKVLVTGGAGFIGSNFIHHLLAARPDWRVVNFDKLTYAGNLANLTSVVSNPNYSFARGDICDAGEVASAMRGCNAVVHFAAESHVDRSIYEPAPAIQTNVIGTSILLQVARELRVPRLLHISTDEVYGDLPPGVTSDEQFPIRPSSPYAASKAAADHLVQSYVRTYGFPAVIARPSNNYGPYQFPEKFLPLIITNALAGKELPIYGDGGQQRNWLHVADNCRGLLAVLDRGRTGAIYNLGGPDVEDNLSMARRVLRLLNKPEDLIRHVADRPGHDRRYSVNCSRIGSELDWRPLIRLDDGLRQTAEWYTSNAAWVDSVRDGHYRSYYSKYYDNRDVSLQSIAEAKQT